MRVRSASLGIATLFGAALAVSAAAAQAAPLVSVQWLNAHRAEPNLVVLDVRSAIDGGGTKAYLAAHIPGSVHSDYDQGGWRVTVHNVPFMLPTLLEIQNLIGDLGIDEHSHVVVVPAGVSYTDFGSAARVYWTLKVAGVPDVSILDGGIAAWKQAGLPTESGNNPPASKTLFVDGDQNAVGVACRCREDRENPAAPRLIDARTPALLHRQGKGAEGRRLRTHPRRHLYSTAPSSTTPRPIA